MKKSPLISGACSLAFILATTAPAGATLLLYEGFTYTGANLNGIAPNTDTVGLRTDVNFGGTGAGTATGHYTISSGLTFGSLATRGNAVSFGNQPANSVASAQLSFSGTTGTLYSSYLVNFSSQGAGNGNGFEVRLASNDTTGDVRFRSFADSRSGTDITPGVDYNGANPIVSASAGAMALGTTYLVVSTFTNVGQDLTPANPGVGNVYVFTNAQFEYMMGQADPTLYFQSLNALSVGTGVNQIHSFVSETADTGNFGIPASYKVHFANVKDQGKLDEIRYATDFLSVVPVPEPAGTAMMLAAVAAGGLRRRRPVR